MDQSRTYVEKVVSFPQEHQRAGDTDVHRRADTSGRGRAGMRGASGTVVLFHSMIELPDTPMMARLYDERVGYFATSTLRLRARGKQGRGARRSSCGTASRRRTRRRPSPSRSKPIVYYVDPATPARFVPFVKKGIEDWQPAFEAAGFRNAHRREGRAVEERGSGLGSGGRPVLGRSLAAVDRRERERTEHPRSAQRRDSRRRHPAVPQRPEPGVDVVLRAGRAARSAGEDRCRCPTT